MGKCLPSLKFMDGTSFFYFLWADQAAVHPQDTVEFGAHPQPVDRRVGMAQVQTAHLVEQQVKVQFLGQALVQLDAFVEEGNPFGRQVIGADNSGGPSASPSAQVAFVQHRHIGHAQLSQVVGRRQSMDAAANNDHLVAVLQWLLPPHPILCKYLEHICLSSRRALR